MFAKLIVPEKFGIPICTAPGRNESIEVAVKAPVVLSGLKLPSSTSWPSVPILLRILMEAAPVVLPAPDRRKVAPG